MKITNAQNAWSARGKSWASAYLTISLSDMTTIIALPTQANSTMDIRKKMCGEQRMHAQTRDYQGEYKIRDSVQMDGETASGADIMYQVDGAQGNTQKTAVEAEIENAKIRAEAAKKNAKVVTVDPSKMVDDGGNPVDLASASELRRWLKQKFGSTEVVVSDNGQTVRITVRGLKDSVKRRGGEQRTVYAKLDELLQNSIYYGYELGDVDHPWIGKQDLYLAAAKIGNDTFGVRFKVDVVKGNEQGAYKDHKVIRIDNVEKIIKNSPLSPYPGFSPSGIECGEFMPVSRIQEALSLSKNLQQPPLDVNPSMSAAILEATGWRLGYTEKRILPY